MNTLLKSPFLRYGIYILAAVAATALMFPGLVRDLLSTGSFMPHATCYLRDPRIIALHVSSDVVIGAAYVSISLTLGYLVLKASRDIPFHWVFLAFGLFIISCGFTHFMEVWTVWRPVYWLAGYVKVITAAASLVTAIALFPLIPRVFRLIREVKSSEERRLALVTAHAELQEAHRALGIQKHELELANRDLEMFAYSVAHDLRGPARLINGFATLLRDEHAPQLDEEGKALLQRMLRSADKLGVLLQDLLEYSRVSRSELKLQPVSLSDIVEEAVESVDPERNKAEIQTRDLDEKVIANPTMMLEIVVNLLSNAIKYVAPGVRPQILIRSEPFNGRVRLWVEDNGIGIPPAQHEKIFGLFVRLHSDSQYSGTGIGLAIVQRAAERMGGSVGVVSTPGEGSRFRVELPKA